ncbi:MAG: discoidin domain-containing protein [Cyanobacteriota bacterium]|nr:discoidin domain-containing protein [Cyanobacteriota bacterium]
MKKYLERSFQAFLMVMLLIISTVLPATIAPDLALAEQSTLFSENFDGMAAKLPSAKWTHTPPTGWKLSNDPKMPQGDAPWQGWSLTTLDVWKAADSNIQARDEFTKASGVFAVADPDEWDDRNSPGSKGTFNSTLATPSIDVVGANNLKLTFDSHWRPYDEQTGLLLASFDGGTPVELLRYDSNNTDDSGFRNQTITKDFNVPDGASKLVLSWQLLNANNDWYWAIDNIALTGDATQPTETLTNVALNKTTSQSSNAYGSNNGIKAVDGKTTGNYWDDSVTHTANNPQEWWQVDLGDVYDIDTIRVYNRTDCCSERLSNFAVMVASEPFPTEQNFSKTLEKSTWSQKFSETAGVKEEFPVKSSGRYVRIQLAGTNYLSLAEVEVFGTPAQTPAGILDVSTIVNIDPTQNYDSDTAVTRNLPTGEYKVEVIGTADGGQFNAWSRKCSCKWDTYYSRRLGSSGPKKMGNPNKYTSVAEALANRVPSTSFTLTDDTDVKFYTYSTSAADNIGGVSMQVEGNGINQSVDLDATQNTNKEHAKVCSLPAGDYTVTLLGTAEGGKYDAWSSTCSQKWRNAYKIRGDAKVTVSETGVYPSAGEALAHRPAAETFRLDDPGEVKFYTYSKSPENDCGGVSLNVTRIGD